MRQKVKQFIGLIACAGLVIGCATQTENNRGKDMRTLNILWQRLVDKRSQTCDRCSTTETAVEEAVQKLKRSLKELDINVVLEK